MWVVGVCVDGSARETSAPAALLSRDSAAPLLGEAVAEQWLLCFPFWGTSRVAEPRVRPLRVGHSLAE